MQNFVSPKRVPLMASQSEFGIGIPESQPDDALTVFRLLETAQKDDIACALITVIDVFGGSARGKGAQMAVLADGRYCGYVSGGCVEAAVAAEAIVAIQNNRDQVLRIGSGSPLMDVRLPCGGGIDVHIHVTPDPTIVRAAIDAIESRAPFRITLQPSGNALGFDQTLTADDTTGAKGDIFQRIYRPRTRMVLVGRGLEVETTARIALASGFEVIAYCADQETADAVHRNGGTAHWLSTPTAKPELQIDPYSAVIFLFHDHDWEIGLIAQVLRDHPPFFIGALGSRRTHALRVAALKEAGMPENLIETINGPVGLFGPTRNAASLALSILAQVTQAREQAETLTNS
ncbi:XdhC family protein [Pelagibacterium luteolum]|uniref:Xanthine dehydrogenase accessory factor n=1 Tax=Pelagibacterium luteolum TaxID=440168 RepID=A0A1G7VPR1_9HYPH|nr:XdhC family protein [Pelagibacterium luteolum]SDG61792.1 xanthine dehydrogenase accessory factor [Pelagibacterium luteolum]